MCIICAINIHEVSTVLFTKFFVEFRWHHFDICWPYCKPKHIDSAVSDCGDDSSKRTWPQSIEFWLLPDATWLTWLLRSLEYCKLNLMRPDAPVWTCVKLSWNWVPSVPLIWRIRDCTPNLSATYKAASSRLKNKVMTNGNRSYIRRGLTIWTNLIIRIYHHHLSIIFFRGSGGFSRVHDRIMIGTYRGRSAQVLIWIQLCLHEPRKQIWNFTQCLDGAICIW